MHYIVFVPGLVKDAAIAKDRGEAKLMRDFLQRILKNKKVLMARVEGDARGPGWLDMPE